MEKKRISVIGSCVCRDLFEDDTENFEFHTDIRFSSPISMLAKPVDFIKVDFDDFKKKALDVNGNWFKKTLINDINKTAFSALKERHGDYLIIDFTEARMTIAEYSWKDHDEKLLVSYSGTFRKQYDANLKHGAFKNAQAKFYPPLSYGDEFWNETLKEFARKILDLFKEENIILIENLPAKYYVDVHGNLQPFTTPTHFHEFIECNVLTPKLNEMFKNICPKAKVISIPPYALGDAKHKWGTNPFHFTKSHYSYLLECVKTIIIDGKENELKNIYKKYELIFKQEFEAARDNALNSHYKESSYETDYKQIINSVEEFKGFSRRKKAMILLACSKKDFFKALKKK